jgi:cell division septum initiation protein DivIVA
MQTEQRIDREAREVFHTIRREWQGLMREEKLARSRFRQASERFERSPTKDNVDELVRRAREYSMRKMKLKKFETED